MFVYESLVSFQVQSILCYGWLWSDAQIVTLTDGNSIGQVRSDYDNTGRFPGEQSYSLDQESGRVGEILNMFDILPTHHDKLGNYIQS